jgi:hypothetical protein
LLYENGFFPLEKKIEEIMFGSKPLDQKHMTNILIKKMKKNWSMVKMKNEFSIRKKLKK